MRVKELGDGTLEIDLDSAPDRILVKGAERSYKEDRIIEAFAILHAHIEWLMAVLYESYYVNKGMFLVDLFKDGEFGEQKYRFPKLKKRLSGLEIINATENGMLAEWYRIRSSVLHRLIPHSGHKYGWNRVTRKEVEIGFNKGIELAELFEQRSVEMNPVK